MASVDYVVGATFEVLGGSVRGAFCLSEQRCIVEASERCCLYSGFPSLCLAPLNLKATVSKSVEGQDWRLERVSVRMAMILGATL